MSEENKDSSLNDSLNQVDEENTELNRVIQALKICGFTTQAGRNAIVQEGFNNLNSFSIMTNTDINDMAKRLVILPTSRGGYKINQVQIKHLQALVYWLKDCERRDIPPEINLFTIKERDNLIKEMNLEKRQEDTNDQATVKTPGKLKPSDWFDWQLLFENFISSLKGVDGML